MNLQQYVHQVLVEENPCTIVPDVQSRHIYYNDVSVNIELSFKDVQYSNILTEQKAVEIIKEELYREFGKELDATRTNAVCLRIIPMLISDEVKQGFYNA